jgi:3-oxoacyl-[acyl-carrier protein] reductase
LVLSRPPAHAPNVEARAVQRSLEGFTRSVAKELGRKGATANQIEVAPGGEAGLAGPLRFLGTPRSAYVSGQVLRLAAPLPGAEAWTRALSGKVALVTGAARGIGAATARALAREGARVVVLDRPGDADEAALVAGEVGGVSFGADLGEPGSPALVAAFLHEKFGGVDIVVHNAGVTRDRTLGRMSDEEWALPLDINLAAVLALHAALSPLVRPGGRVVCLSSIAGLAGNVGQASYAASKAGIVGFVEGEAPLLAARGIALNAVAPGFIETRMTAAIPMATREVARRLSNLSQGGLPEDVAEAITFFSTPGAAGCVGQVLRVCGGSLVGA